MKICILLFLLMTIVPVNAQKADKGFANLQVAWQLITNFHVDSVNRNDLAREAIEAMLGKLDPHSAFIPADRVKSMSEILDGNFEGVGIEFAIHNDTLIVISTIPGGPSEVAGVLAGDRIIAINDSNIASVALTTRAVTSLLRGPKGTSVDLTIWRRHTASRFNVEVTRDKVPIQSLEAAYMVTPETGYIKISRFAANTHEKFSDALRHLKSEGMENLVLDLRGNGGGYMRVALDITDEFLGRGQLMLFTEGAAIARREHLASSGGLWQKGDLVILMDENSASASEIVAGAVQDWDRGVVVGTRSFGKGLVQRPFNLPDGSEIRLTIANYYTPSGRNIQKPFTNGKKEDYWSGVETVGLNNQPAKQFETLRSKRIVSGGGGIVPDVNVAHDTSNYSDYYMKLVSGGVINRVILEYMDNNRVALKSTFTNFNNFRDEFEVGQELLSLVITEGEKNGIPLDPIGLKTSSNFIETHLKALIARDLWTSSEFFQMMNPMTNAFNEAIAIIEDRNLVSAILR